jgi:hypothetical protein
MRQRDFVDWQNSFDFLFLLLALKPFRMESVLEKNCRFLAVGEPELFRTVEQVKAHLRDWLRC